MTRLGLILGLAAVVGVSAWGITRGGAGNQARAAEPADVAADDHDDTDSTHDAAVHRYRTNQATHWRHVMVGRR